MSRNGDMRQKHYYYSWNIERQRGERPKRGRAGRSNSGGTVAEQWRESTAEVRTNYGRTTEIQKTKRGRSADEARKDGAGKVERMKTSENLKPFGTDAAGSVAVQRAIQRAGGIASGKARREMRTLRELVAEMLTAPAGETNREALESMGIENPDRMASIAAGIITRAEAGDAKALEQLLTLTREDPYALAKEMEVCLKAAELEMRQEEKERERRREEERKNDPLNKVLDELGQACASCASLLD